MKRAFTLIELLVVIAIIAILAAILFPVFAQAKLAAKKTQDLSNVKNIGTGVILYLGDSDDVYPLAQRDPDQSDLVNGAYTPIPWQYVVNPYVKNGDKTATVNTGAHELSGGIWNSPGFPDPKQPRQYGINVHIAGDTSNYGYNDFGAKYASVNQTSINLPADKVLLGAKGYMGGASGTGTDTKDWSDVKLMTLQWAWATNNFDLSAAKRADQDADKQANSWPWAAIMPRFRYSGISNFAFADGHAKGFKIGQLGGPSGWCHYLYVTGTVTSQYGTWYPQQGNGIPTVGDSGCSQWNN